MVPADIEELGRALAVHGLIVRGGFHPEPEDAVPGDPGALVMVGNAGPAMWDVFARLRDRYADQMNPLDAWITDTVGEVCEKVYRLSEDARAHPSLLTLVHDGQKLDKRRTLADCGIGKEAELTSMLGQGVRLVELNVRGQRCSTTLDTLLADSRSVLFAMFEPMARGAEPRNRHWVHCPLAWPASGGDLAS